MAKKKITAQDAVDVLNRALEADRGAVMALRDAKVPCNDALALDPTIQVSSTNDPAIVHDAYQGGELITVGGGKRYQVGFLGMLNGIFGILPSGQGRIAAVYELVCANCTLDEKDVKGLVAGSKCPSCGMPLRIGRLMKFVEVKR